MSRQPIIVATVALLAGIGGAIAYLWLYPAPDPTPLQPELTLTDLNGDEHSLHDYRERLVLVNFWATWCQPCLREVPMLIEAQRDLAERGLQILGPALDDPRPVRRFAESHGMNYPVFADIAQIGPALGIMGDTQGALPYTVLLDGKGQLVDSHYGELNRQQLDAMLAPHWPEK